MAARAQLPHAILRPISGVSPISRRHFTRITFPSSFPKHPIHKTQKKLEISKWAIKLSLQVEQSESSPKSTVDVQRMVDFLYEDLPHLFDDQGIDRTAYDKRVMFRDPITKHDTISGYLLNIVLLKQLFRPDFQLHWAKQ
ncbi:hypothetical protein SOVF_215320, partial [Spinacia oleracea]